jgi:hypothetical protein
MIQRYIISGFAGEYCNSIEVEKLESKFEEAQELIEKAR